MHTLAYSVLVLPSLMLGIILCSLVTYSLNHSLSRSSNAYHNSPTNADYSRLIFFAILTPLFLKFILVMKDVFTLAGSGIQSQHQKERTRSNFDGFVFPIVEEFIKFGLVYYLSHFHKHLDTNYGSLDADPEAYNWSVGQVAVLMLAFNLNELVINSIVFSPIGYATKYSKFFELFELWHDHESKTMNSKTDAALILADSIIKNSKNSSPIKDKSGINRNSVESSDTAKTLVPNKPQKIAFPPTLDTTTFDDDDEPLSSSNKSKTLNKFQSMPILSSSNRRSSPSSDSDKSRKLVRSNYKSCYDLVDKLYSVSPKNTYHLNEVSAYAINIDDIDETFDDQEANESIQSEHEVCPYNHPLHSEGDPLVSSSSHTHFGGGGGGNFKYEFPSGRKLRFGGGAGFDYESDDGQDNHENGYGSCNNDRVDLVSPRLVYDRFINAAIPILNWFQWLVPFLPINSGPNTQEPNHNHLAQSPKKRKGDMQSDPLIKKQLSHYTLNRRSSFEDMNSLNSIRTVSDRHSIDLENQHLRSNKRGFFSLNSPNTLTENDYLQFQNFVLTYFDYDLHTFNTPFKVDPIFKKFNVLSRDINSIYLIIFNIIEALRASSTLLIYSTPFLVKSSTFIGLIKFSMFSIIIKLFNLNFLNFQIDYKPFQVRLILELINNLALYIFVLYFYFVNFI